MPSRRLEDSCSFLQESVPRILDAYNGRYAPLLTAKVGEVLRTQDEQQAKYAQGRTRPGKIVTRVDGIAKLSNHQARLLHGETKSHAVDLDIFREDGSYVGNEPGDEKCYLPLIGLCIAYGAQSGGEWLHPDLPHCFCAYAQP